MESAGRALSFWAYQSTQEIPREMLTQRLRVFKRSYKASFPMELTMLSSSMLIDGTVALSDDCDDVRRKHEELAHAYQDKCRKLTQVQELYDRVKRKAELGQMEAAAVDAVASTLQFGTRVPEYNKNESAARLNIYEQQSDPAHRAPPYTTRTDRQYQSAHANGGSGTFRGDLAWSRSGPAQGGDVQTPRGTPRTHGVDIGAESHARFGSSAASKPAVRTSSSRGISGVLGNASNIRNQPVLRGHGLGLGLSSGIRTSHTSQVNHGSHNSHGSEERNAYQLYAREFDHMPGP
ncbi:E3 ubiquitin-protein ligase CCNB1IP1 [Colletotrichum higginsianum IMI 349063]|uniref:E3 ubiquitin-protein ligase CCNB1IP1 n=2 Tax=Colletotrichum higginsianum (strain IMI 349063) TaxID=759273 RepID=A0A1B7YA54_COLHI|nr:E3 ubiquitin-protein ligase CCNB1IP1 [Colletotrichum higginsianum IMI 349063]OBR08939.1 E3 ubiquitin-protein ligase CCNB1IP1 [Colletotrichum higginsianum IMI 349063]